MTTYTSQPDGTDGLDTWIYQNDPTYNKGTETTMQVGFSAITSEIARGLLKFDLSVGTNPPPSSAIISSAVISLNCTDCNVTRTLALYQCLRGWVEAQATWNIWSTGNNWTTAGAGSDGNDYSSTELGSVSVASTGNKDITLNSSGLAVVQGWIDGTIANNGFVLRNTAETTQKNYFAASDHATANSRPKIVVEYTAGGPTGVKKVSTVAVADIKKISGVAIADIKKVSGVG